MAEKKIIITGSGSGIGRGFARALADEGARVGVMDLNKEAADAVVAEITSSGGQAIALTGDVSKRDQVRSAFAQFVDWAGGLDVLFNNAGFNKPMPLLEVTEENWNAIMNVNGLGVLICVQEGAKYMIPQKSGKIVNTASIAGRQGYPAFVPYSASKFAVNAITQATARELAKHGITCNSFAPGVVDTPLWITLDKDLMEIGESERPGQAMADFSAGILKGRPALAEDLVGTALFLASSDSDYMTGQTIMIDGGMVLV
ncbi:MAG: SDR family NAD(P)-dependent oxidoreductase [Candidatus Nanopelagicaceae bacterium]|nr:SDR family NAD(P)-dependent oxidoreductase [Candidatus Nanopelagicaceae bacterium]